MCAQGTAALINLRLLTTPGPAGPRPSRFMNGETPPRAAAPSSPTARAGAPGVRGVRGGE